MLFSSVLEGMSGGEYVGAILKGLAYFAAALTALFGVLYKLGKLPFTWVESYKSAFRTHKGDLKRVTKKRRWSQLQPGDLKRTRHGFVIFLPYGKPIEEYDHRVKPQVLQTLNIEMFDGSQWQTQPMIYLRVGVFDADVLKVREREDPEEQVRGVMGMAIHNAIRTKGVAVLEDMKSDLASILTDATVEAREALYGLTGIEVTKITFPSGIYRTEIDALRRLGTNTLAAVGSLSNGSNGHRSVGV